MVRLRGMETNSFWAVIISKEETMKNTIIVAALTVLGTVSGVLMGQGGGGLDCPVTTGTYTCPLTSKCNASGATVCQYGAAPGIGEICYRDCVEWIRGDINEWRCCERIYRFVWCYKNAAKTELCASQTCIPHTCVYDNDNELECDGDQCVPMS